MFTKLPGELLVLLEVLAIIMKYRQGHHSCSCFCCRVPACPVSLGYPLCLLSFSLLAWGLLPHIAHASHGYFIFPVAGHSGMLGMLAFLFRLMVSFPAF